MIRKPITPSVYQDLLSKLSVPAGELFIKLIRFVIWHPGAVSTGLCGVRFHSLFYPHNSSQMNRALPQAPLQSLIHIMYKEKLCYIIKAITDNC